MKNLLKGTILLACFSISLGLIQMSCSKSDAQTPTQNLSQLNKVIYLKYAPGGGNGQIWTANYDGTGAIQIPVALTSTMQITYDQNSFTLRLSPDGQKVFFSGTDTATPSLQPSVYSCNIDGSNVQLVVSSNTGVIKFGGAY